MQEPVILYHITVSWRIVMKKVVVLLADGFEEVEAITPVDYLRRAGIDVRVIALNSNPVYSARKLSIFCDSTFDEEDFSVLPDMLILPGGMPGASHLGESPKLRDLACRMADAGMALAAICAAPALTLAAWGLVDGCRWTCYPGMEDGLPGSHQQDRVVRDRTIITARAAGTAEEFALELVDYLAGSAAADRIRSAVLAR